MLARKHCSKSSFCRDVVRPISTAVACITGKLEEVSQEEMEEGVARCGSERSARIHDFVPSHLVWGRTQAEAPEPVLQASERVSFLNRKQVRQVPICSAVLPGPDGCRQAGSFADRKGSSIGARARCARADQALGLLHLQGGRGECQCRRTISAVCLKLKGFNMNWYPRQWTSWHVGVLFCPCRSFVWMSPAAWSCYRALTEAFARPATL